MGASERREEIAAKLEKVAADCAVNNDTTYAQLFDEAAALLRERTETGTCHTCGHWDELDNYPDGVCRLGVSISQSLVLYPKHEHFGCTLHIPPSPEGDPR